MLAEAGVCISGGEANQNHRLSSYAYVPYFAWSLSPHTHRCLVCTLVRQAGGCPMCRQDKHKTAMHACCYQCCMRQSMPCQGLPLVCPKRKAAAAVVVQ